MKELVSLYLLKHEMINSSWASPYRKSKITNTILSCEAPSPPKLTSPLFWVEPSPSLKISHTINVWVLSTAEKLPNDLCLNPLNNWEPIEQTMFESSQQRRTYRTNDVWVISTVENLSNKRCLNPLNSEEPIEQTMYESSQQWKTYRTNNVWSLSTVENLSNKRCVSHRNSGKPIEQTTFESSQQRKTYQIGCVWTVPTPLYSSVLIFVS